MNAKWLSAKYLTYLSQFLKWFPLKEQIIVAIKVAIHFGWNNILKKQAIFTILSRRVDKELHSVDKGSNKIRLINPLTQFLLESKQMR